jgi:gamma-glutamylcyclotransferase (GGCT)/AIG2-like uncharacterized protein YtfP
MTAPVEGHLFVYGTLMTAAANVKLGRSMRARLQREGERLGAATIEGRLYDLGRYPALVPAQAAGELVHGEVFRLADPAASLRWLDAYENVAPDDDDREYDRVLREVRLAGGEAITAWVYIYRGPAAGARHIPEGQWHPK